MENSTSSQHIHHHFQKLPVELITVIFVIACEDDRVRIQNAMHEPNTMMGPLAIHHRQLVTTPGTLSQVCSSWRDFIYNCTPMLWDALYVSLRLSESSPQDNIPKASMKMRKWLLQAENYPLTVKIQICNLPFFMTGGQESSLIEDLFDFSSQWKSIDIFCPGNNVNIYAGLQNIMQRPPASLEAFTCRPSNHCPHHSHPKICVDATPNLKQISLFSRLPLSVQCLSEIKICKLHSMTAYTVINMLKDMVNIVDCCVVVGEQLRNESNTTLLLPSLQLPFLENLSLYGLKSFILRSLKLPALRQFTFADIDYNEMFSSVSVSRCILSMLQQSNSPDIQFLNLDIKEWDFNPKELFNILQIVPSLKHLTYSSRPFRREIYCSIVPTLITHSKLTTLHIYFHPDFVSEGGMLVLHYLKLPALEEVQLLYPDSQHLSSFKNLLRRSNCPLKTLKIETRKYISNTSLIHFLNAAPTLKCLHIIGNKYWDSMKFEITSKLFNPLSSCEGYL
ncbi:hypothetical protein BDQ17DRAFT_1432661 [Cyathus striatus]|nr:hypothetical protein BDQ17DRAFT_1432661 [Cyathus striatus]